jgi:hypothetical protein
MFRFFNKSGKSNIFIFIYQLIYEIKNEAAHLRQPQKRVSQFAKNKVIGIKTDKNII